MPAATTTANTAAARGKPRRLRSMTTGLRMNASRTAKATGTMTGLARARHAMTATPIRNFVTPAGIRRVASEDLRFARLVMNGSAIQEELDAVLDLVRSEECDR